MIRVLITPSLGLQRAPPLNGLYAGKNFEKVSQASAITVHLHHRTQISEGGDDIPPNGVKIDLLLKGHTCRCVLLAHPFPDPPLSMPDI